MGEGQPATATPILEGEENLITAAQNIVKALETKKNFTNDALKILADLGTQLSSMAKLSDGKVEEEDEQVGKNLSEVEEQLNRVENKVMKWEENQSVIWDCGPDEAYEYLKAVDEARKLAESLESLDLAKDSKEDGFLQKAHDILQIGMVRLEEEFKHLLVQNRQPFEPEHVSFRSSEDDNAVDDGSIASFWDESVDEVVQRDSVSRASEEYIIELVHPDAIPDLKSIASLMFLSNYGRECSQAYVSVRKDALDDCLFILEVEKLSIEDVLKMDWNTLNSKIRRWVRGIKIFVRVYLASERLLCDQIFGELESVSLACFAESSKASILQLLNFGEAISVGTHQPEKLFRILDMHEVLADLMTDNDALYPCDDETSVRMAFQDVLRRLGDCAKATFLEFENAVANKISANAFPGGGIHHLTKYVMNYITTLADYGKTLDVILRDNEKVGQVSSSPDMSPPVREEDSSSDGSYVYPVALHFRSLLSILECNLEDKSNLYKDVSLRHFFLMNNIHYMAQKTKSSDKLRTILGDGWIRKHNWKFQQHAMNYERATWSSILNLLRDEGIQNPGSNSISRTLLRDRLQSFYTAFEEVYKNQTGWLIPDIQLREDLRISASLKVIHAYRTFVGRHINYNSERHVKYNADDLEDYILHLFEGSAKSLHGYHRK